MVRSVREFDVGAGVDVPEPGAIVALSPERARLRERLLAEEVRELGDATTLAHQLKELMDVLYVAYGTAASMGLTDADVRDLFGIVHDSNMTKVGPGAKRDSEGKILKGDRYVSPMEKIEIWVEVVTEARGLQVQ